MTLAGQKCYIFINFTMNFFFKIKKMSYICNGNSLFYSEGAKAVLENQKSHSPGYNFF